MNNSLSKSEAKSLGCEYYYTKYYLEKVPQHVMPWTRVGTEFHDFMERYVKYLVAEGKVRDTEYVDSVVEFGDYSDETVDLIIRYTERFELADPAAVLGIESFLVVDSCYRPIRNVAYPGVGKRPEIPGAFAHGTLDRIERVGEDAILVTDYKTGFMPSRVDEYEPQHYAILAMAHYPWANTVTFRWEFVRFGNAEEVVFTRAEWPELVARVTRKLARRQAIRDTAKPECNSMAGLCGYCALSCPLREAAMKGGTIFRPIQTPEDAALAASTVAAIRSAKSTLESQLKTYVGKAGAVQLPNGNAAYLSTTFTPQMGARTVLAALGIEVPEKSEAFDVSLDSLIINNTEFKRLAGARKRQGLLETVLASVPTKPRTDLAIGRMPQE
jgi:hypothetical protein